MLGTHSEKDGGESQDRFFYLENAFDCDFRVDTGGRCLEWRNKGILIPAIDVL